MCTSICNKVVRTPSIASTAGAMWIWTPRMLNPAKTRPTFYPIKFCKGTDIRNLSGIGAFRYRTHRMLDSPAFRHKKKLSEGGKGFILHVHTYVAAAGVILDLWWWKIISNCQNSKEKGSPASAFLPSVNCLSPTSGSVRYRLSRISPPLPAMFKTQLSELKTFPNLEFRPILCLL